MTFRWFSIQIVFQVNLVGVQKPVLNPLEEWISRIFKNLKENAMNI